MDNDTPKRLRVTLDLILHSDTHQAPVVWDWKFILENYGVDVSVWDVHPTPSPDILDRPITTVGDLVAVLRTFPGDSEVGLAKGGGCDYFSHAVLFEPDPNGGDLPYIVIDGEKKPGTARSKACAECAAFSPAPLKLPGSVMAHRQASGGVDGGWGCANIDSSFWWIDSVTGAMNGRMLDGSDVPIPTCAGCPGFADRRS